ncbi:MAG: response regulator [Candidatus Binatus sp.]|uniref:response regulator n=1 Tax=Candidatus Binatus sp. TaxID=2811406 RepID=UPI002717D161|nr:response regulator [Candidatus Binatus sp.]MDO8430776.1 response regulator [Candidatus Binatus sp.]
MKVGSSGRRILVVEDDADAREALVDILEVSGYEVVPAENGKKALEYLKASSPPSLIIRDLLMPEMDGWEFRARQRENPELARVPVVVVTAFSSANVDANDILIKPIDVDRLLLLVKQYVDQEPAQ